MCGITFILSKNKINIIDSILNSIELIQNRGYDSMGICYYDNSYNNYKIIKYASTNINDCYDKLKETFINNNIKSYVGLGHTRWATHGSKTDNNAHPHISENKNIILVHNGIINNFNELRTFLTTKGYIFYSETDTEVIANLIEYYLLYNHMSIEDAIKTTINKLEGTWALVIIYTKTPDIYYVTRKGSPLLLGNSNNYIICTSEVNGFNGLLYDYIILDNHDIIKISNNDITSISNDINNYNIKKISNDDIVNKLEGYKHWMLKEIEEQPETIQKAYNYGGRVLNNIVKLGGLERIKNTITNFPILFVLLIGCGTSYNAGLIGAHYFNSGKNFVLVECYNACEFTEKNLPNIKNLSRVLCIFLSQSGETIDVYNSLKICKNKGCLTLGVINKVDSLIARNVDCGVYLNAGNEISVASTKSFTSMLIVLSLIQMWFTNNNTNNTNNNINTLTKINNLRLLSNTITQLLNDFNFFRKIDELKTYIIENNINNIFILGKNKLYPIACESCLKIKEVCYIHTEAFSAGSLKHGPFALLDKTNLTILLIDYNDSENYDSLKSTYYEILSRDTNIFVVTNNIIVKTDLDIGNSILILNSLNYYNEIIFIIALQYLAYKISVAKNINPDKPRNLAKVVTVE